MIIRKASPNDLLALENIAAAMGARHEQGYFAKCLAEQAAEKRTVFIAFEDDLPVGYAQLNWQPVYVPFRRLDIPEIQDLNVIPQVRQQGIGGRLVDHCEDAARKAGKTDIGISVGIDSRYGPAQRLYVHKGYAPDGSGVAYDDVQARVGDMRAVGDMMTLKLVKGL